MRRTSAAVLCLALAACQPPGATGEGGSNAPVRAATGLERAAIESGVIADTARTSPIGLYQRSHEAGRDSLCIMPGANGGFRFGMEALFGEEPSCRGRGAARRAGDKLVLSFKGGARCIVVAQYDGDRVALPGVVDMACARLCEGRGSLEGVSFPRVASDAAAALRVRARDGETLCGDQ